MDRKLGTTIYHAFTSRGSTGQPTTLDNGGVAVFKDGSAAAMVSGAVLSVDVASITGFNRVTIAAMSASGFESPADYNLVVVSGSVSGIPLAGELLLAFTLGYGAGDLTFTKPGEVDANVQSINSAEVVGDGNATPWDGA